MYRKVEMKKTLPISALLVCLLGSFDVFPQSNTSALMDQINTLDVYPEYIDQRKHHQLDSLYSVALKNGNKTAQAKALWLKGKYLLKQEKFDSSYLYTNRALAIGESSRNDTAVINSLQQLADIIGANESDERDPTDLLQRSEKMILALKDTTRLIRNHILLANNYSNYGDMDSALIHGRIALKLSQQQQNLCYQAVTLHGIGVRYYEQVTDSIWPMDSIVPAILFLKTALNIHEQRNDYRRYAHTLTTYTAALYWQNEKNPEIKPLYLKALQLQYSTKDSLHALETLYNLAVYEESIEELDSALVYWREFRKLGLTHKSNFANTLMLNYINSYVNNEDVAKLNKIFELAVRAPENQIENFKNNIEVQRERNRLYWIIGGLMAIFVLAFFRQQYQIKLQVSEREKLKAEKEKELTELQTKLNEYEHNALESALHTEQLVRDKIGQDLHDGPAAYIAAGRWSMEAAIAQLEAENHPLAAQLRNNLEMQNQTYSALRSIIHRTEQDPAPWVYVVAAFCKSIAEVTFTAYNVEQIPNGEFGRKCRRLVTELVHNARRHSGATEIKVELVGIPDEKLLSITVHDNGHGFNKALVPKPGEQKDNHGLANMVNITHELGGTIEFETQENSTTGTTVSIDIPLPAIVDTTI